MRGVQWLDDPKIIVNRLEILLEKVALPGMNQKIWWWGANGDCPINDFEKIDDHNVIIDSIEIRPIKMAAINLGVYYQTIIYLESDSFDQTGVYPALDLEAAKERYPYPTEEYAIINGAKITREEYDDGAYVSDGKPIEIKGNAKLRVRHLTPWNFFIAPHGSPINTSKFDPIRKIFLEGLLDGSKDIDSFIKAFGALPKRPW